MDFRLPPKELIPFGLRAMKTVALADGQFDTTEREMLEAAQRFHGTQHDVDALEPIEPSELAQAMTDPQLRMQVVQALVIVASIDGAPDAKELAVIERFATPSHVNLQRRQSMLGSK